MVRSSRPRDLTPDEILAGRSSPSAEELVALIHAANPTGQGLSKREAERRYATKSRLQSLLVQRFRDDLVVERADEDGVILLRHRYLGRDACHAVLADLNLEARSWAQMQLDTEANDPVQPVGVDRVKSGKGVPAAQSTSVEAALREGRRALDDYDFEAARHAFESAHRASPRSVRPVCALLDLLVNQLALDGDALALAETLDDEVLRQSEVLAMLALAAARTGDLERAERWAQDLEGQPAASVYGVLASAALDVGELSAATAALQRARRMSGPSAELEAVSERLAQARAAASRPFEAELEELLSRGDLTAAADLARRILADHPGSVPARAVLKDLAARTREAELVAAHAEVEAALVARDVGRARLALSTLRAAGADDATLAKMNDAFHRVESEARQVVELASIRSVADALARAVGPAELEAALEAHVKLDRRLRAEVCRRSGRNEVAWLDEVEGDEPRLRKLLPAVLALSRAEAILAEGDPEGALAAIECHRSNLRDLRSARGLVVRIDEAVARWRREQVDDLLTQSRAALASGDLVRARSTIESLRRLHVSSDREAECEAFRIALTAAEQRRADRDRLETLFEERDLVSARRVLVHLLAGGGSEQDLQSWRSRIEAVEGQIRRDWIVLDHYLSPGVLAARAPEMAWPQSLFGGTAIGLLPGGREAVFVLARRRLLFVRLVDVDSGQLRRVLILRVPADLGFPSCGLGDNSLWILSGDVHYLEISCEDWLPRRWSSLKAHVPAGARFEDGLAIPRESAAWLRTSDYLSDNQLDFTHLVDVDESRMLRKTERADMDIQHIPGSAPTQIARINSVENARIVTARGASVCNLGVPRGHRVLEVTRRSTESGFLALTALPEDEDIAGPGMNVSALDERGTALSQFSLPGFGEGPSCIATVRGTGMTYVCFDHEEELGDHLVVLREQGGTMTQVSSSPVQGNCGILQDEAATTAVAVRRLADGIELTRLGETAPRFSGESARFTAWPYLDWPFWCTPTPPGEPGEGVIRDFYRIPEVQRRAWVLDCCQKSSKSPSALLCLHRCAAREADMAIAAEVLQLAQTRHPNDVYVRLALVENDARAGLWSGDSLLAEVQDARIREHLVHLHALVLLRVGEPGRAVEILKTSTSDNSCNLAVLSEMAAALASLPSETGTPGREPPGIAGLIHAAFRADLCVAGGDLAGARAHLDRAWIRDRREEQTMARLARLYLDAPPPSGGLDLFRMASALAEFSEGKRDGRERARLALGEHSWSPDQIASLVDRADRWIEETLLVPR